MSSSSGLPPVLVPAGRWTQVDWFAPGPFPFGIVRTYCAGPDPVRWRYFTAGYAEGSFSNCAQITIVGTFYISVEMFSPVDILIFRS